MPPTPQPEPLNGLRYVCHDSSRQKYYEHCCRVSMHEGPACLRAGRCLQGVVSRQRQRQAACEERGEGVAMVIQEQGIVGQRAHAQPNLRGYTPSAWFRTCLSILRVWQMLSSV